MSPTIPRQHPAVVLRSHYQQLRALLAVTIVALVGLTAAVVILATDNDRGGSAGIATQVSVPSPTASTRFDGGPEEGTRGALSPGAAANILPGTRYDGGPEEGTRGAVSPGATENAAPGTRFDGGPEEGSRGIGD